jgi:hypothetical protein
MMYIGLQAGLAWWSGTEISSALLHLFGTGFGLAVGIALLKLDWVDCEGWDLFHVLRGSEGEVQRRRRSRDEEEEDDATPVQLNPADSLKHLAAMAGAGHTVAVPALYQRLRRDARNQPLPRVELVELIKAMHEHEAWADSIPIMVDCLRMHPDKSARVRLRLAQVVLTQQNRPSQALRVLHKIEPGELPENLETARRQLVKKAEKMRAEGEMELQTEDW